MVSLVGNKDVAATANNVIADRVSGFCSYLCESGADIDTISRHSKCSSVTGDSCRDYYVSAYAFSLYAFQHIVCLGNRIYSNGLARESRGGDKYGAILRRTYFQFVDRLESGHNCDCSCAKGDYVRLVQIVSGGGRNLLRITVYAEFFQTVTGIRLSFECKRTVVA